MTHSGQSIGGGPSNNAYKKVRRSVCPSSGTTSVIGSNEIVDNNSSHSREETGYSSVLYSEEDSTMLSEYQCEIRKNLEIFEAGREYVLHSRTAGRKGLVALTQIGIRCVHCAHIDPSKRPTGAAIFPQTIAGVYQVAQNLGRTHLCVSCTNVPQDIRDRLMKSRKKTLRAKNGKNYWAKSVQKHRVIEVCEDGVNHLRLAK
jgi:hypothetical protein